MTVNIVRGSEHASPAALLDRTVAVLGYGNQGAAHALNLRDSAVRVIVGNRPQSPRARSARDAGFDVRPLAEAAAAADLVVFALPDEVHGQVYPEVAAAIRADATIGFLHGFSVRFGAVVPAEPLGVIMVAPKGPGATLRQRFVAGQGLPCLLAVHRENAAGDADTLALAWAAGLGCDRAGIVRTTFGDEAETDLFGEQAVLCGGLTELMLAAFDVLVERGYPPELAYLECCQEVKQIADLVYERGLAATMEAVSNTAEFGAAVSGPRVVDDGVRDRLREMLDDIRAGRFAATFARDTNNEQATLRAARRRLREHPAEAAGAIVRGLFPYTAESKG